MSLSLSSPLSLSLYQPQQVRELDRLAIEEHHIPGAVLMKRAGRALFTAINEFWPELAELHVFCGSGNNGGDGYVVAALAAGQNIPVTVWQFGNPASDDAARAKDYAQQQGAVIREFSSASWQSVSDELHPLAVIVDALLGTGFKGELRPLYQEAIAAINHSGLPVIAADIPSGIDGSNGCKTGEAVSADITLSFIGQKLGNVVAAGRSHSGRRLLDDLEVPLSIYHRVEAVADQLSLSSELAALPPRDTDSHKGDFGHLCVIGGDQGMGGAVLMAAEMAARSGAGLVSVATRPEHTTALLVRRPEVMALGVNSGLELLPALEKATVLVLGPGLGQSAWSEQLLHQALAANKPLVLDADALNLLAQKQLAKPASLQQVITPHPGEAARLLGISTSEVQADRLAAATALQQKFGGCVILKGAGTIVVGREARISVCDAGNPAMASGGMGDVLAGLVGGLMAQGLEAEAAARLGVILHSSAADKALEQGQGERSLLATDLIPLVAQLLHGDGRA